jgi:hypothetical protein
LALAARVAAIVPRSVAVVAGLRWIDPRIPAYDRHTKEPGDRTSVAVLYPHAIAGAAVVIARVVVVAGLDWIAHAIAAAE